MRTVADVMLEAEMRSVSPPDVWETQARVMQHILDHPCAYAHLALMVSGAIAQGNEATVTRAMSLRSLVMEAL